MSSTKITKADLGARIMRLPADQRDRAIHQLKLLQDVRAKKGSVAHAKRDFMARRRYKNDPWAYGSDVFGLSLSPQQNEVIDALMKFERLLIPSANNVGKTFVLAFWGLFRFDVLAALEGDGVAEQGCRILLPGPDHSTVHATIYSEMLTLAARAEMRGHLMPGDRSDLSVNWRVRAKWEIEAFSPPKSVGKNVAHTASGRHHANQVALIEEGQGVPDPVWRGAEGMCSSEGNQIASSFNPTESIGPAFQRARNGSYRVIHLSAFDHPNVLKRGSQIPAAVSFKVIDARVRSDARDRGAYPSTPLEPEYHDFLYALPPEGAEENGPREDGIRGHPDGEPRVYRPDAAFTGQVLGQWPSGSDTGLFDPGAWDAGVHRNMVTPQPTAPPDRVGVDIARDGKDESVAAPSWGQAADAVIRLYADAQLQGQKAVDEIKSSHRIRVGEIRVLPKGDGIDTAQALDRAFPNSPFVMDESSVGSSPYDHMTRVMGSDVIGVSFSAVPQKPLPGEPYCENLRTQLYVRAAMLTARGLVDPPDDPILREEIMAHQVTHTRLTITREKKGGGVEKVRVDAVALLPKDDVKKLIGRSPDRSDGYVLSLFNAPPAPKKRRWVPMSESSIVV